MVTGCGGGSDAAGASGTELRDLDRFVLLAYSGFSLRSLSQASAAFATAGASPQGR